MTVQLGVITEGLPVADGWGLPEKQLSEPGCHHRKSGAAIWTAAPHASWKRNCLISVLCFFWVSPPTLLLYDLLTADPQFS